MDIGPLPQQHCAKPKVTEADVPNAKRRKVCEEKSPSEKDDASEKTTSMAADEKDSNANVSLPNF